jgi:hypothetical protein
LASMLIDAARRIAFDVEDAFWTKPKSPREAA